MEHPQSNKTLLFLGLIFVLMGTFYFGFISGQSQTVEASKLLQVAPGISADGKTSTDADFELFWKVWNLVDEKFAQTKVASSTTDRERVYGAIQGMVDAMGDPYTVFFPPQEATAFETEIDGNFEGVGMEMGVKDEVLTVVTPLKGSPAERAGIRAGDKVIAIEGKTTQGMSIDQSVKIIRGKKGTTVNLTVAREGEAAPLEFTLVRDVINLPTLDTSYNAQNGIFTIKLYNFSAQSTALFRNALREFVNTKSNKLVLDLRGNPGGFLEAAVDMASWFLPPGKIVVTENYGNGSDEVIERSRGYNIFNENLKMVILVDGGSASASEILAGALSEYGKAQLVGTKTFGKGSVQEYIKVNEETALKVTVARWLTPNGKSISEGGLTPDVEVKLTADDVKAGRDLQMDKAIEILLKP
ncbi:MAG TPA: S41 family peptidase [Candidatus Paceibacterota bacterium]